jgi:radical SAM protein with 4Fe4S-binding SPASM domain
MNKDNKIAYLEVGNQCFCNCVMCDIHKKPHEKINFDVFTSRVDKLIENGFNQIRLAGNDPLTHPDIIDMIFYIKTKTNSVLDITTTLLSPDPEVIRYTSLADILRVSLFAVYDEYEKFYNTKKWSLLCNNLKRLQYFNELIFNYTLVSGKNNYSNYSKEHALDLVKFVKNHVDFMYIFNIFPSIDYKSPNLSYDESYKISCFLDILNGEDINFSYIGQVYKKMSSCSVNSKSLYVRTNGDVYPCCMAGGEIGQELFPELLLGNIDKDSMDFLTTKKLTNLNNITCDYCTPKYWRLQNYHD